MRLLPLPAARSALPVALAALTLGVTALPSGTAAAAADPFRGTGRLAVTSCPEPPLIDGGVPRSREYLTAAVACLNRSWSAHFARAGLTFRKPAVRFYEEPERRVCGVRWPSGAAAFYCTNRATLVFPLTGAWIEGRTDLYPLKVAAHEYGHHLQSLTGIRERAEARARAARNGRDPAEPGRRYELQADCLAGVFLGSVRRSLARSAADWEALSEAIRASGDDGEHRTHGSPANRVRWFERGYRSVSPAACDTWPAPRAEVS